jgi:mono/diheme cytochrome c family protein
MRTRFISFATLFFTILLAIMGDVIIATAAPTTNTARLQRGKILFESKCATCHNNDGLKPLHDGSTLMSRLAKNAALAQGLGGRGKDLNATDREALVNYIGELVNRSQKLEAAPPR